MSLIFSSFQQPRLEIQETHISLKQVEDESFLDQFDAALIFSAFLDMYNTHPLIANAKHYNSTLHLS